MSPFLEVIKMAEAQEKTAKQKKSEAEKKSHQEQLNEIDQVIASLQLKKKELSKLALKDINEAVEMPLHQLNSIGAIGYEASKKKYGESWVE